MKATIQTESGERIRVIDGLRGIAILLVVLYHVFEKTHFVFAVNLGMLHFDAHTFVQAGFLGVEVFFFVSGFCLMLPYAAWMAGRMPMQPWREYVSRRFWKIVPSYYLALAVFALWFPFNRMTAVAWPLDVFLHATFLHGFQWPSFVSINGNFWSLAVEVEFYVLFPLIVLGFVRAPLMTTALVTVAGLEYSSVIAQQHLDGTFMWSYQLPSYLPLFALGVLSAWIYERFLRDREFNEETRLEFAAVTLFSIIALGYVFAQLDRAGGGPLAWSWENANRLELGILLSLFTLSASCAPLVMQRWIANPVLTFFSDISYNMYLWNAAVVAFVAMHWHGDTGLRGGIFCAFVVAGTTLLGFVLTRFFERPLMRNRFKIFGRFTKPTVVDVFSKDVPRLEVHPKNAKAPSDRHGA